MMLKEQNTPLWRKFVQSQMSVEKFGSSFLYKGNLGGGGEFREGDYSGGYKNQMLFRHNSVLCKENGWGVLAAGEALGSLLYTLLGKQKSRNSFLPKQLT